MSRAKNFNNCMAVWTAFTGEMVEVEPTYTFNEFHQSNPVYGLVCTGGYCIACGEYGIYYSVSPMTAWTWMTINSSYIFYRIASDGTRLIMLGCAKDNSEIITAESNVSTFGNPSAWTITATGYYGSVEDLIFDGSDWYGCGHAWETEDGIDAGSYTYRPYICKNGALNLIAVNIGYSYGEFDALVSYNGHVYCYGYEFPQHLADRIPMASIDCGAVYTISLSGSAYCPEKAIVAKGKQILLARGSGGQAGIFNLTDGGGLLSSFGSDCRAIVYANGKYYVTSSPSSNGRYLARVYRSKDLVSWELLPGAWYSQFRIYDMIYNEYMFLYCGRSNYLSGVYLGPVRIVKET